LGEAVSKEQFGGRMFPVFFVEVVPVGKGVDLVGKMGNHKELGLLIVPPGEIFLQPEAGNDKEIAASYFHNF
jgi:hypothetical protein